MRPGIEADDRLEDPEIVHDLDQKQESGQRQKMRDDHEAQTLPAGCTVELGRFVEFVWNRKHRCQEDQRVVANPAPGNHCGDLDVAWYYPFNKVNVFNPWD